jgi:hypothetical protein
MRTLTVSWQDYLTLKNEGRVSPLTYKDDRGIDWTLSIEQPSFGFRTDNQTVEQRIAGKEKLQALLDHNYSKRVA